jgi:thiol-disulfide isomerase/thioredoxin
MDHDHGHDHRHGAEDEPSGFTADHIDRSFAPIPRPEMVGVEIDGETVIVDGASKAVRHLDPIGSIVWQCFDSIATLDEISADLAAGFKADPAVVATDVLDLTQTLGRQGLLEGVDPDLPPRPQEPSGLPPGTELQSFRLDTLDGGTFDLERARGSKLMLVNWSPRCGFCDRIAPDLIELQPHLREEGIELVLLSLGNSDDNAEKLSSLGVEARLALKGEMDLEVDPFRGLGTPSAYLVDEDGRTMSELAVGAFDVPKLMRETVGVAAPEPEVKKAEPEPEPAAAEDDRAQPKFLVEPKST